MLPVPVAPLVDPVSKSSAVTGAEEELTFGASTSPSSDVAGAGVVIGEEGVVGSETVEEVSLVVLASTVTASVVQERKLLFSGTRATSGRRERKRSEVLLVMSCCQNNTSQVDNAGVNTGGK